MRNSYIFPLHEYLSFAVPFSSVSPTTFIGESMPTYDNFPDEPPPEGPTDRTTTTTTNGDSQERIYQGLNDKLIPIYCSILAAVVVGIVAFVIFKKWGRKRAEKLNLKQTVNKMMQTGCW